MTVHPEEDGYFCSPGFVKGNPKNNTAYLEMYREHPWHDLLVRCDAELEELCPGYNIAQIKEKFGGLRYYISQGDCPYEVYDPQGMEKIIQKYEREVDQRWT